MKRLGIAVSALLMVSAAANAADLNWNSGNTAPIYSPTPASGWSGFYLGANAGWGFGTAAERPAAGGATTENNTNGGLVGAQVGYNLDVGGFVLGTEADLQWAGISNSREIAGGGTFKTGVDFFGTVRARAGVNLGQVMPYVTGGFAAGRGSASVEDGVTTTQTATHLGWTIGAGMEAQISSNVSIKAEYLYTDLGAQTYSGLPGGSIENSQRFSVVRAGLNYKF